VRVRVCVCVCVLAEAEKVFMDSMQALDVAMSDPRYAHAQNHHMFLKIMTEVKYEPEKARRSSLRVSVVVL
jgi:hypothetical protein